MKKFIQFIGLMIFGIMFVSCATVKMYAPDAEKFDVYSVVTAQKSIRCHNYAIEFGRYQDNSLNLSLGNFNVSDTDKRQTGVVSRNITHIYDVEYIDNGYNLSVENSSFSSIGDYKFMKITRNGEEIHSNYLSFDEVIEGIDEKGKIVKVDTPLGLRAYYKNKLVACIDFEGGNFYLNSPLAEDMSEEDLDVLFTMMLSYDFYLTMFKTERSHGVFDPSFNFSFGF